MSRGLRSNGALEERVNHSMGEKVFHLRSFLVAIKEVTQLDGVLGILVVHVVEHCLGVSFDLRVGVFPEVASGHNSSGYLWDEESSGWDQLVFDDQSDVPWGGAYFAMDVLGFDGWRIYLGRISFSKTYSVSCDVTGSQGLQTIDESAKRTFRVR